MLLQVKNFELPLSVMHGGSEYKNIYVIILNLVEK